MEPVFCSRYVGADHTFHQCGNRDARIGDIYSIFFLPVDALLYATVVVSSRTKRGRLIHSHGRATRHKGRNRRR